MNNWKKVVIGDDEKKFFQVKVQLPPPKKEELIDFLSKNMEVFAWNAYEAPRVDPNIICHHLNVNHLSAHLGNIMMSSRRKCSSSSELGL